MITQIILLGNGPAGIALSAMLSGLRPFYVRAHPDPEIHSQFAQQQDQQYESSSSAMAGREGTSLIDMARLFSELIKIFNRTIIYRTLNGFETASPNESILLLAHMVFFCDF